MKKYFILGFLLLALVAVPLSAKALTVDELRAKIAELTAQLNAMLNQQGGQNCFTFTRDLTVGSSGRDVNRLIDFLISKNLAPSESEDRFTEEVAMMLVRYQTSVGIPATGYFGPITRAHLNSIMGCNNNNNTPVISGVSGPTSLSVGQTGMWTINISVSKPDSLTFSVDWGDGSSKSASRSIGVSATITHSYSNAGTFAPTFTVTNSSGQSAKTSISVNVGNVPTVVTETAEVIEHFVFDACPSGETAKGSLMHGNRPVYLCTKNQTIVPKMEVIVASKIRFDSCADGYTASSYVSNFDGRNQTLYHCVKKASVTDNGQTVVIDSKLSPTCSSGYTETSWFNDSGVRVAHCMKAGKSAGLVYGEEDEGDDESPIPAISEATSKGAGKNEIYLGEDVMVTGSNLTGLTTANIGNRTIALTDNNGTYAFFTAPSESVLRPGSYNFKLSSKSGATNSFKVTVKRLDNTTPQIVEVIEHFVSGACPSSEVAKGNLMNGDTPIYLCARTQTVVEGMHVIAASRIRFDNCSSAGYVGSSHVSDFDNRNRTLYHCIQSSAAQSGDTAVVDSLLAQTCPSGYTETSWFNDGGVRAAHCVKTQTLNFGVPSM